ncbi:MAG: acyl-CoA dehydrogenase [Alphaproteobacteria bacterium]|nr:acyl-CoA dehydrogenase [Alphaproteobacteria bacterium]
MTALARKTEAAAVAHPTDLFALCRESLVAAEKLGEAAKAAVLAKVTKGGKVASSLIDQEQLAVHGYAWLATTIEALRQMLAWAEKLGGACSEMERSILLLVYGEYLSQIEGGLPMSQVETVRPRDFGLGEDAIAAFRNSAVRRLQAEAGRPALRRRIAELAAEGRASGSYGADGLDETMAMIRDQFRRFAEAKVIPFAPDWHKKDELIPMEIVSEMAELGVFGLTIPEEFGGHGLGKTAMCVVSEELSRGYIGVGSLGTRSEIAGELILRGGTDAQKRQWLPKIASGEILPTAVFTEPNTGSDLGSLRTRAIRDGKVYRVTGNKTWITHAARSDVMTLLARTNQDEPGYKGLSMFIAPKPRGTEGNPFPAKGMRGGEIRVIGYRGMKEYELGFDGFEVAAENLLGGEEGNGFKQLMATFESARVQTAARATGVAHSAVDLGLKYALERVQFGKPIFEFPRVHGKIAWMVAELMVARQLTHFAAREKDEGRRCDLEAGMAKLLAARVAWANADNALQIHGGNGYAEEYPISRVLCDARILNIFEGAAEIQAQVIARRLLEGGAN